MTFSELPLQDSIQAAIAAMGFESPTPIQEAVIPEMLEDSNDLIALAQTGTGKTAAFGLPILEKIQEIKQNGSAKSRNVSSLMLCPTRELALQITKEMQSYAAELPQIKIAAVYGGAGYGDQIRALKDGVDILVATPGRLLDLINKGKAKLHELKYLVLDEADIMLNMGFKEELDAILEATPQERRSLLFSATMPKEVARIAEQYMQEPVTISMGQKNAAAESVEHFYYLVHSREKYAALKRLVDFHPEMYGIVFCRTKASTQDIADRLLADGYDVESLHGDLSQMQRELVMKKFRNKHLQILVATDIAARGLDVQELSHVIHYDLPDEIEIYTHRSGRTGRAGKKGTSYAIVGPRQQTRLKHIEKVIKREIQPGSLPKGDDIFRNQLLDFAKRLAHTEVNEEQISNYLEDLRGVLGELDRDELLNKIISLQFEQMLEYYHDLPEMTPVHESRNSKSDRSSRRSGSGYTRGDRSGGRNGGRSQSRNRPGRSRNGGVEEGYTDIRVNLGKKDKVAPPDLIGLINQSARNRNIEIGQINIHNTWSSIQVDENFSNQVAKSLDGFTYQGRNINANLGSGRGGETVPHKRAKDKKKKKNRKSA